MISMELNEHSAEDLKQIRELQELGLSDEIIQVAYSNTLKARKKASSTDERNERKCDKMSGGSHGYIYCRIDDELCGEMCDPELNDLMEDVSKLAHDLEWWDSSDIGEKEYRETVRKFKEKWFNSSREERLKKYVDEALKRQRAELYNMIGIKEDGEK